MLAGCYRLLTESSVNGKGKIKLKSDMGIVEFECSD
jgi:hypothetical protein